MLHMAGQGSRSATLVLLVTVAAVLLSCRGAAAARYVVGNSTWALPGGNDLTFYDDWSAKQQFVVGDTLEFKYEKTLHNVASLNSSAAFDQCDVTKAVVRPGTGNSKIKLKSPGTKWYVCQVNGHCNAGMKVKIVVLPTGGAPTPSVAPTAGGLTNAGNPAAAPGTSAASPFSTTIGYATAAAVMIAATSFFL